MAIGLISNGEVLLPPEELAQTAFLGELSLNAELKPVNGVLPMAMCARDSGIRRLIVPADNLAEAKLVRELEVYGFSTLREVVDFLLGTLEYAPPDHSLEPAYSPLPTVDFADVQGQEGLLAYVVAAVAGGHNFLMLGSPGCGKSMIAKRIPTIMPKLTEEEALEITKIYSVTGLLRQQNRLITERPFRAPHHNASMNALIGGGSPVVPGEISLAHNGVLFLDEIAEFERKALDALRQPLEDKVVTVSRVKSTCTFPANFMLVAAMNPCPCGYHGQPKCRCTDYEVVKYHHQQPKSVK